MVQVRSHRARSSPSNSPSTRSRSPRSTAATSSTWSGSRGPAAASPGGDGPGCGQAGRTASTRCRPSASWSASALPSWGSRGGPTGSCTSPRTSDGATSHSRRCSPPSSTWPSRSSANEADSGRSPSTRRGRHPGVANLVYISGEVGIGAGDRRRQAAARFGGVRGRGRPHPRSTWAGVPVRRRRVLGGRGRRGGAATTRRRARGRRAPGRGGRARAAGDQRTPGRSPRSAGGSVSVSATSSTCSTRTSSCSAVCELFVSPEPSVLEGAGRRMLSAPGQMVTITCSPRARRLAHRRRRAGDVLRHRDPRAAPDDERARDRTAPIREVDVRVRHRPGAAVVVVATVGLRAASDRPTCEPIEAQPGWSVARRWTRPCWMRSDALPAHGARAQPVPPLGRDVGRVGRLRPGRGRLLP